MVRILMKLLQYSDRDISVFLQRKKQWGDHLGEQNKILKLSRKLFWVIIKEQNQEMALEHSFWKATKDMMEQFLANLHL